MEYALQPDPEMLATTAAQTPAQTAAPAAPQLSAAAQSFLDRVDAYEAEKRAQGYLVKRDAIVSDDMNAAYEALAAQLDKGLTPADLQVTRLGHAFKTNAGKAAKTKANPTGEIYATPGTKYRLTNERGQDAVLVEGEGQTALDQIYSLAKNMSETEKKKANWKVEVYEPGNNKWRPVADDDPPSKTLSMIAKIGLPIAGALVGLPVFGLSGLGASAAGAAAGSALGGALAGDSLGSILKGAALSGGLTFAGGSLLGGAGSGGGGTAGSAGGAGGAAGGAAGSAGGALGAAGDIVVQGIRNIPTAISGAAGALGSAGAALAAGGGGGSPTQPANPVEPNPITVVGSPPPTPPLDPGVLAGGAGVVGAGAALGGGGGTPTTDANGVTNDPNPITVTGQPSAITNLDPGVLSGLGLTAAQIAALTSGIPPVQPGAQGNTLNDIVNYLQAAGLLTGFLGDLFGGGGGGGSRRIPAGWGSSALGGVFTKPLPTANLPGVSGRTARLMPPQDWTKYAMRPEQSFWSNVPSRYTPPPPGQYDLWGN